ncbi:MAG: tol-pal system protein YbgF [Rhodospirillaceae bacterium]|nr:tol-pal system protein YbgF [Rhodospirillaceae bacterium]
MPGASRLEVMGNEVMKKLSAIAIATVLVVLAVPAQAQSGDVQDLSRELDRLRNDLVDLQRFIYAGEGEVLTITPSTGVGEDAAQFQLGLQHLEERVRLLTGQIEELQHQQRQMNARLDSIEAQIASGAMVMGAGTDSDIFLLDETMAADDGAVEIVPDSGTSTELASGAILPPGPEMDQYNFAFSLLRKADYGGAEMAFNEFITLHPESELTGNAYYWLGSTHFVRDQFRDAAVAFLKGYQQGPTGPKAADNLLKLGVTLSRLEKFDEACATFTELENKFPEAALTLLDEASDESAAAGCS